MKIDTEDLRSKVLAYYDEKSKIIDDSIENDDKAIKVLTRIEKDLLDKLKIIEDIEVLAKEFN